MASPMTHAALKDLDARIEAVRKREKDGCPLARELRVLRDMCSCGNDDASVSEAEVRYLELAALSAMEGEAVRDVVVDLPDGDNRKARVMWVDRTSDPMRVCIVIDAPPPQQAEKAHVLDLTESTDRINVTPSPGPQGGGDAQTREFLLMGERDTLRKQLDHALDMNRRMEARILATPPAQQPGEVEKSRIVGMDCGSSDQTNYVIACPCGRLHGISAASSALAPKEAGHGM